MRKHLITAVLSACCLLSAGTTDAQVLVRDLTPGMGGTLVPAKQILGNTNRVNSAVYKGKLLFAASSVGGNVFTELYETDGTTGGTKLLKNIHPTLHSNPSNFFEFNGELFFQADDGTHGYELWKTDGTANGTVLVKDIWPGAAASTPVNFVEYKGQMYFMATMNFNGELWRTDGTSGGTVKVADLNKHVTASGKQMAVLRDTLFFIGDNNRKLYKSGDGLNFSLCEVGPGVTVQEIMEAVVWDSMLVFTGYQTGSSTAGNEIYSYDTSGKMQLQTNIMTSGSSNPWELTVAQDKLFFSASGPGGRNLYVMDDDSNTVATLVADINPGVGCNPGSMYPLGNRLLFTAVTGPSGSPVREAYCTDGSPAGTYQLTTGTTPLGSMYYSHSTEFVTIGDSAYFVANPTGFSGKLYLTDGTTAGTHIATELGASSNEILTGVELMPYNNELYFFGQNGRIGTELYVLRKRWLEQQDSVLDERCKVWLKADTNYVHSGLGNGSITYLLSDVKKYENFRADGGGFNRTHPAIGQNVVNGLPAIEFNKDGEASFLSTETNLPDFTNNRHMSVIAVASKDNTANNRNVLFTARPIPSPEDAVVLGETNRFGGNDFSMGVHNGTGFCDIGSSSWTGGQFQVISAYLDDTRAYTKFNGTIQDSVDNICAPTDAFKVMTVGGAGFGNEPLEGDIAELFVFDTILTRPQRNMIELYLAHKYRVAKDDAVNVAVDFHTGIYLLGSSGIGLYFVKNNDPDQLGTLRSSVISGNPGASGFSGSATSHDGTVITPGSVNTDRYWQINNTGLTDFEYDIMIDIGGMAIDSVEQRVILKRDNPSAPWVPLHTKRFDRYLYAYGLTGFSEFAVNSGTPLSIAASPGNAGNRLALFPNPAGQEVTVRFDQCMNGNYTIDVYNLQGMLNSRMQATAQQGVLQVPVNISQLPAGLYIVELKGPGVTGGYRQKLIKQ